MRAQRRTGRRRGSPPRTRPLAAWITGRPRARMSAVCGNAAAYGSAIRRPARTSPDGMATPRTLHDQQSVSSQRLPNLRAFAVAMR